MMCPYCNSSYTKKDGTRTLKSGERVQDNYCNNCEKHFTIHSEMFAGMVVDVEPGEILTVKSDKSLKIHGLTDIHVGANEFDYKKFKQAIGKIKRDDNARWFGNGDLIELIPPHYKISQRGQNIPPDEQYLEFLNLVDCIKDKCLFIRGGNHDYLRSFNILDFDVCKVIAKEMNVPYYRMPGYTTITINGKSWNLVSGHGKSGAKNGDLELDKMAAVYSEGDVFFLGHNHQLYVKPMDSLVIGDDATEELRRRWYIRGGSFLRYAEYARYSFFPIIRTGWVTMTFRENKIHSVEN